MGWLGDLFESSFLRGKDRKWWVGAGWLLDRFRVACWIIVILEGGLSSSTHGDSPRVVVRGGLFKKPLFWRPL